jgi:hypothetical protein
MKSEKIFTRVQFGNNGITGFKVNMHDLNCIYGNAKMEPYFWTDISYEVGEVVVIWAELEFAKRVRRDYVISKVISCIGLNSGYNRFKIGLQICSFRTSI